MKKILKIIVIILLIFVVGIVLYNMKLKNNLRSIGYNEEEVLRIYEQDLDIKLITKYEYCSKLFDEDFNKNDLEVVLNTCHEEPEDPFVTNIKLQKYYIPDNLDRYIAYNDGKKTYKDIVTEVNCGIDSEFYTNTKKTDLSKGNLILVNKYNYLDENFVPINKKVLPINTYTYWENAELAGDAYDAFVKLVDDAKELGYKLIDTSPYRTYSYQDYLYNNSIKNNGLELANKLSAKPGHSEHQTGLATDIVKIGVSMYDFYTTKEFTWLKDNAHNYGFILRYPEGKEYLTGYMYEPWHYRYVGVDVATYIYENDIVFEEYYAYFCEYKNEC